jgi:hypothetical protein
MAYETSESDLPIPDAVAALARRITADHKAAHDRFYPPTHEHAGQNSERQSIGLPGHCWACAVVGHVVAHPDYGCGDVQCNFDH